MYKLTTLLKEIYLKEEEIVYHGSPNRAIGNKFSTHAINSGAGAQTYGWGLYFGKNKSTALGYAHKRKAKVTFNKESVVQLGYKYDNSVFFKLPPDATSVQDLIDYAKDMIEFLEEDSPEKYQETIREYKEFIEIVKDFEYEQTPTAYFYTVKLFPGRPEGSYTFMDWNKKLPKAQVEKINKQAEREDLTFRANTSMTGAIAYLGLQTEMTDNGKENPPKEVSMFLLRAGIDGNTHSDGSVRILFDDKQAEIINIEEIV
jgi:hypothetical protein